jgi:2C-methyl-D-erythritol 2,4-cyclodiphosphate synthase
MDINPGIELVTNRFDRVLSAFGTNDDGKTLLAQIDYKNAKLDDTIDNILDTAKDKGYLTSNEQNALVLTVSAKSEALAKKLEEKITSNAKKHLETMELDTEVITDTVKMDRHEEAIKQGITPGKLNIINKLMDVDKEATVEKYKDTPVKDILKRTKELKKQQKKNAEQTGQDKKESKEAVKLIPGKGYSEEDEPDKIQDKINNKDKDKSKDKISKKNDRLNKSEDKLNDEDAEQNKNKEKHEKEDD